MAHNIQSKTVRRNLKLRREPYWSRIQKGLWIGYRQSKSGEGTWIVRKTIEDNRHVSKSLGHQPGYDEAVKAAIEWNNKNENLIEIRTWTVADACKSYVNYLSENRSEKTAKDARLRFTRLVYKKPFGRIDLDNLKPSQLRDWVSKQIKHTDDESNRKSKDSANRNLASLKAAFNHAFRDQMVSTDAGWKTVTPFKGVSRRRERFLSLDERRRLIKHCDADIADFVKAMMLTLARPGELANCTVKDFNARNGSLELNGKTGRRIVTLSTEAIALFKKLAFCKLPEAPLIGRQDGHSWSKESWKKRFKTAVIDAGLPGEIVLYHIRHAAISEAIANGIDCFLVAKLAGTSTEMIDKHYGHLRHDVVRKRLDMVKVL